MVYSLQDSDLNVISINQYNNAIEIKNDKKKQSHRYTFDYVGAEDCSQEFLFDQIGNALVTNFISGYNVSLFAYGQTGSGKTYTIQGPSEMSNASTEQKGIVPRLFPFLFNKLQETSKNYKLLLSYYEIYNEQMKDLLKPESHLTFRAAGNLLQYLGLAEVEISNAEEALHQCYIAINNRRVDSTECNESSSRSHSILMLQLDATIIKDGRSVEIRSKMHIVDLAGSERTKKTGCVGKKLKESSKINQSLSTLSHVINTIIKNATNKKNPEPVRYRDSVLTTVLRDSLGGNSKTIIIANVSPCYSNFEETLSTLIFAQNAKLMPNKPIPNAPVQLDSHKLQEELTDLKISLENAYKDTIIKGQHINVLKDIIRTIYICKGDMSDVSIPIKDIEVKNGISNTSIASNLETEISELLCQKQNVPKQDAPIIDEQLLMDTFDPFIEGSNIIDEDQRNQEMLSLEFQIRSNEAEYLHSKQVYEQNINQLSEMLKQKTMQYETLVNANIEQTTALKMEIEDTTSRMEHNYNKYMNKEAELLSAIEQRDAMLSETNHKLEMIELENAKYAKTIEMGNTCQLQYQQKISSLQSRVNELSTEICNHLQIESDSKATVNQHIQQIYKCTKEIQAQQDTLSNYNQKLKHMEVVLTDTEQEKQSLSAQLTKMCQEFSLAKSCLDQEKCNTQNLNDTINTMTGKLSIVENESRAKSEEIKRMNSLLTEKVCELENEMQNSKSMLAESNNIHQKERESITSEHKQQMLAFQINAQSQTSKIQSYEKDLYQGQLTIGALNTQIDEIKSDYTALVTKFNQLSIEKKATDTRLSNTEDSLAEQQNISKQLKEEHNIQRTEQSQQIAELMTQLEESQTEKENISRKLCGEFGKNEEKSSALNKKIKEIVTLQAEVSALKGEKEKWMDKAIKLQQNFEQMSSQKANIADIEKQALQLKAAMDDIAIKKKRIKDLEEKLKRATDENKLILAESKENLIMLNQDKIAQHTKAKKFTTDDKMEQSKQDPDAVYQFKKQMAELMKKIEVKEGSIEELRMENTNLKQLLTKSESDNMEFLKSKNDKIGYLQNIKIELNKLREENAKFKMQSAKSKKQ